MSQILIHRINTSEITKPEALQQLVDEVKILNLQLKDVLNKDNSLENLEEISNICEQIGKYKVYIEQVNKF